MNSECRDVIRCEGLLQRIGKTLSSRYRIHRRGILSVAAGFKGPVEFFKAGIDSDAGLIIARSTSPLKNPIFPAVLTKGGLPFFTNQ